MTILNKVFWGYLAGLSVGVSCIGLCLPVFLPVLLSQKRTTRGSFYLVIEFSFGRLIGYLLFGLIIGISGQLIKSNVAHFLASIVSVWQGILLILYSLGKIDKKYCAFMPFAKIRWAFLIGFLTGVNVCPPFLSSLAYVFNLRDAILSLLYFLMFFLGTSTYIVPLAFLGVFTRVGWLQRVAQVAGVFVGLYFVLLNLVRVW